MNTYGPGVTYLAEILRGATPGIYPESVLEVVTKINDGTATEEEITTMLETIEQVQSTWEEA